uniref:Uncharacterized protein n=1 Tax=Malurus cyaneus samueli TaxID=2593467 RepID=A0A8C5U5P6_9PASS
MSQEFEFQCVIRKIPHITADPAELLEPSRAPSTSPWQQQGGCSVSWRVSTVGVAPTAQRCSWCFPGMPGKVFWGSAGSRMGGIPQERAESRRDLLGPLHPALRTKPCHSFFHLSLGKTPFFQKYSPDPHQECGNVFVCLSPSDLRGACLGCFAVASFRRPQEWAEAAGSLWHWKFPLLFLVC